MFWSVLVVAFLVGVVIGVTGMGGGALMTPALIYLGIPPTVAVSNDLVASVFNKMSAAGAHWKEGTPNKKLALWLVIGAVPAAFAGGFIVRAIGSSVDQQHFIKIALGIALLIASLTYTARLFINNYKSAGKKKQEVSEPKVRPVLTLLTGIVGGLLVGLTSVGAGSIIMVAMLLIYPRMKTSSLVGTDLLQAVPLVIAAAASHLITTGIDWSVFIPLIIGSVPGTIIGAKLAKKVEQKYVRRMVIIILIITGLALLSVPTAIILAVGVVALIFGPTLLAYPVDAKKKRLESDDSF
jgi:uncharacterized membrane protein YfcA